MSMCPLCNGDGEILENKVHFGDGQPQAYICPACRGSGRVEIEQTRKRTITIVKPHGVWCSD